MANTDLDLTKQIVSIPDVMRQFIRPIPNPCRPYDEVVIKSNNAFLKMIRDDIFFKYSQKGKIEARHVYAVERCVVGREATSTAKVSGWIESDDLPQHPLPGPRDLTALCNQLKDVEIDELFDMGVFVSSQLWSNFITAKDFWLTEDRWNSIFSTTDDLKEWYRLTDTKRKAYMGQEAPYPLINNSENLRDVHRKFNIVSTITPMSDDVCKLDQFKRYYTLDQAKDAWTARIRNNEYPDMRRIKEKNNHYVELFIQNVVKHLLMDIPDEEDDKIIEASKVKRGDKVVRYVVLKLAFEQFWEYLNIRKMLDHEDLVYRAPHDDIVFWTTWILESDMEAVWELGMSNLILILRYSDIEKRLERAKVAWELFYSGLPDLLSEEEVSGQEIVRSEEVCEDINGKFWNPWHSEEDWEEILTKISAVISYPIRPL